MITATGRRKAGTIRHCFLCLATEQEFELIAERNTITGAMGTWCENAKACRRRLDENMGRTAAPVAVKPARPSAQRRVWMLYDRSYDAKRISSILGFDVTRVPVIEPLQLGRRLREMIVSEARATLDGVLGVGFEYVHGDALVLIGRNVTIWAMRLEYEAFAIRRAPGMPDMLIFPAPSFKCREWDDPTAEARARAAFFELVPELAPMVGGGVEDLNEKSAA